MYLLFVPAFIAFAIIFTIELEPIVASLFSATESVAPEPDTLKFPNHRTGDNKVRTFDDSEELDISPAGW